MTAALSEIVRRWLGWCPKVRAVSCRRAGLSPTANAAPASGGNLPARTYGWLQRFRNWVLVQALVYAAFVPPFMPLFLNGDYLVFFVIGAGTATLAFILIAPRLWGQYDEVLAAGHREESDTTRNAILYSVVSTVFLLIFFEMLVWFAIIPGIDFLVLPAFMIGLTVLPWYVLVLVIVWEARTGCRLYLDEKGRNASMFVIQEP